MAVALRPVPLEELAVPPPRPAQVVEIARGTYRHESRQGSVVVAHPRRVVPGETYLVTRRCSQRAFRLRPCAETNRIFMYCIALAMQKTGVRLHAACVMANHHHLVVTDTKGVLPEFLRELHRLTAKAINASQGQWENLWAAEPCNVVRLVTDDDVEDKVAYVIANPVTAGLVRQPDQWPGFVKWGEDEIRVDRPASYFREDGDCPDVLTLKITRPVPRDVPSGQPGSWRERIGSLVAGYVEKAHREMRRAGRVFLGRKAVLAGSCIRRTLSYEPRFGTIPTFAAKVREVRERLRTIERVFRARYRHALDDWRKGMRHVVFPFGTWGMRVAHAALVEDPVAT
jgi:REP element-mobilizing transposase RayT